MLHEPDFLPDRQPNTKGFRQPKGGHWTFDSAPPLDVPSYEPRIDWPLLAGIALVLVGVLVHWLPMWAMVVVFGIFTNGQVNVGATADDHTGDSYRAGMEKLNLTKGEWINIRSKAVGCQGDGATDDTANLTAALANAPAGTSLYAPPGTYNFTGITWNVAVDLVGEGNGTIFNYTPTTGTAFTITGIPLSVANASFPGTYGFYRFFMRGTSQTNTAIAFRANTFWFEMEDVGVTEIGLALTWSAGSTDIGFQNFTRCVFASCGQLIWWPAVGAGEKIAFTSCSFVIATTFANGILLENGSGGGLDMGFFECAIDNTQFVVNLGSKVQCVGCHFEMVNLNPSVPMIKQLDGVLSIVAGVLLVPGTATSMPQAISVANTLTDSWFYCYGLTAYSGTATPAFLTVAAGINVHVVCSIQGFNATYLTGTTVGNVNINISPFADYAKVTNMTGVTDGQVALTSGTAPAINVSKGSYFTLAILTNIAVVIAVPTGRPFQGSQEICICMRNQSGGALTTPPTFNTGANGFKFSAVTNPANGLQVEYRFRWDPVQSFWYEVGTHLAAGL